MHFIANMTELIFAVFIYSLISGLLESQPRGWGWGICQVSKPHQCRNLFQDFCTPNQLSYNEHIDRTLGRCGGEGKDWPRMLLRK